MMDSTDRTLALDVKEVDFSYGQLQVLFGLCLQVHPGEAVAVLGTNGAGKSTFLRVITGLEKPSRGSIAYFGRDISAVPAYKLPGRGLVMIAGGQAAFGDMTVGENLEMQACAAHLSPTAFRVRLDSVYSIFPTLAVRRRQKAGTLSGGEQHQVALAKALLLDPKVLCIDELSQGLAPVVVEGLLGLVRRINSSGVAVIVVEQNLNIAAEICERAVFVDKGRTTFEGATKVLMQRDDIVRAVFLGSKCRPGGK